MPLLFVQIPMFPCQWGQHQSLIQIHLFQQQPCGHRVLRWLAVQSKPVHQSLILHHVINSAVFHSGFLVGSDYFDYQLIKPGTPQTDALFKWREEFFEVCNQFNVKPAHACVQFSLNVPGVKSIALNTTEVNRVKENLDMASVEVPVEFWKEMQTKGLTKVNFFSNRQPVFENKKLVNKKNIG